MIVIVSPTSTESKHVYSCRHGVLSARSISVAYFDTVIRVIRVVGVKDEMCVSEDRR